MTVTIENGEQVTLFINGIYSGNAGRNGGVLAFPRITRPVRVGLTAVVDGVPHTITKVEPSPYIPGWYNIEVSA